MIRAAAFLLAALSSGASAQTAPVPGEQLAVYLVSFGPGPRIWERFGHNAIWIRDTVSGNGPAFDYGRFTFEQEHFFLNFAQGRMMYWMGREDGVALINFYMSMQRSVTLQELNLPPPEREQIRDFLEARFADNRGRYAYNPYWDNCSTRVRDAIDSVVGGAIRSTLDTMTTGRTYRFHTRRSLQSNALDYFGVIASLGPVTDQPISAWQEAFLPLELRDHLREVSIPGPDGAPVPLVRGEIAVSAADMFPVPPEPANWTLAFLGVGLLLGGLMAGLGSRVRKAAWARKGFMLVAGTWTLVAALAGTIFVFFWAFSAHVIAYRNANLWQLNLLSLALLPMLPAVVNGRTRRGRTALGIAGLIAISALLGLLLKGLPGMGQANGDILALTLPAQLGLAAGVWLAVRSREPSAAPPSPR